MYIYYTVLFYIVFLIVVALYMYIGSTFFTNNKNFYTYGFLYSQATSTLEYLYFLSYGI